MWPFNKKLVDCNTPVEVEEDEKEKIYDYHLTYIDNLTENIQAHEFDWNEHDIVFRKEGLGVFWVRADLVKTIQSRGEVTTA